MEAKRQRVTCPRSHSNGTGEPRPEATSPDGQSLGFGSMEILPPFPHLLPLSAPPDFHLGKGVRWPSYSAGPGSTRLCPWQAVPWSRGLSPAHFSHHVPPASGAEAQLREGRGWALSQSHMFTTMGRAPTPLLGQAGKRSAHTAQTSPLRTEPRHTTQMFTELEAGCQGGADPWVEVDAYVGEERVYLVQSQGNLAQVGGGGAASGWQCSPPSPPPPCGVLSGADVAFSE